MAGPGVMPALRVTAPDLLDLGVVDAVIPEPTGGAHNDWDATADSLRQALVGHLSELKTKDSDTLRRERWEKFESMGAYRVV